MTHELGNDNIGTITQLEDGRYGEFKLLVDGEEVISGGPLAFLGVLPTVAEVRRIVAERVPGKPIAP